MSGKEMIYEGQTKQDKPYVIRHPQEGDAGALCSYINALSKERTFIGFQGEQISKEEEVKWLKKELEKIHDKKAVQLLASSEGEVLGVSSVELGEKIQSHVGLFGISITKDFRGQGIGTVLMKLTLEEAVNSLSQLRIITLAVFADNLTAREMYKKFGFQEYGRLPEGVFFNGKYVDDVHMYKKVK